MTEEKDFRVWKCKVVIAGDSELPNGFDAPPRRAAQMAVEDAGFEIISTFSGWNGKLTATERVIVEDDVSQLKETEIIELDLSDEILLKLAMQAHEKDITLNQFLIDIVKEGIKRDFPDIKL